MARKEDGLDIIRRTGHNRRTRKAFRKATRKSGCRLLFIAIVSVPIVVAIAIVRRVR